MTGQRSNQLNYVPLKGEASQWWALSDLNGRPFGCKPNALTAELSALTHSSYRKRQEASTRRQMRLFVLGNDFLGLHFYPSWTAGIPLRFAKVQDIAAS